LQHSKKYKEAVAIYEQVASKSYNDLAKWSVKDYFFKSLLCCLANDKVEFVSTLEIAKTKLGKYQSEFPAFVGTREQQFIQKLIDAKEADEVEKFEDAVFEFDRISKLNPWQSAILVQVKKQFEVSAADDLM